MRKRGSLQASEDAVSLQVSGTPRKAAEQRLADLERRLHETEQALRLSNSKLRMAVDIAKLGSWERDLETGIVTGSPLFKSYLGLKPEDTLTYEELTRLFHPADAERIEQAINYAVRTRTDFNIEHRVIRENGRVGRVLARGGVIYDGDKPIRIAGVLQDVTEREKAKEEANLAQRRQEFLLELNDQIGNEEDPLVIMETAARCLANFLKADSTGYGEVFEKRGVVIVEREWSKGLLTNEGRVEQISMIPDFIMERLRSGLPVTTEDARTDPNLQTSALQACYNNFNIRAALATPLLKNGQLIAVFYVSSSQPRSWTNEEIALVEDVAERTWLAIEKARAEIGLRETETRFRIIAESLPALVWILDTELRLTYTNDRWLTFSGLPPSEALGESWMAWVHPEDLARVAEEVKIVRENKSSYTTEMRYRTIEGVYHWHMIQAAPLLDQSGELTGWCGTSVDIHDLKETEAALRTSEERLALAQSAAGIGVFDWHIPTDTVTWTAEQERLFGMEPGSFKGAFSDWADRVIPEDRERSIQGISDALARKDKDIDFIFRMERSDGILTMRTIALFFYDEDGKPLRMVGVNIDITKYKEVESRQDLLIRELHHRVKNTLATVQAIVGSTARTASTIDDFYQGFVGRIVSLARTHNLLTEDLWQKADLQDLVQTELGPYEDEARNRIVIDGPRVELPSEAAVPIGMAIHELTTNAAKHGALSTFGGQVEVRWRVEAGTEQPMLQFSWTEHGGPRVATPSRQGFGTRLLQRVLTTQLQAQVNMDFQENGLNFSMLMPIPGEPPLFNPDK